MTNSLVPVRKSEATKVSLADLQDRLDARKAVADNRAGVTSTRKGRVADAKRGFEVAPLETLVKIQESARELADAFDASITEETVPLSQAQINKLSEEFLKLERLKVQIEALEARYRPLVFGHLDEVGPKIPGRPAAQVPGKVAAEGPGPHYVFERRGGNRTDPDLDVKGLYEVLPAEFVAEVYLTVHHDAIPARDELVFDESRLGELVDAGLVDLDVVAPFLTAGKWRTPSFYKTLVDGEK
jgi:hypothetical protein